MLKAFNINLIAGWSSQFLPSPLGQGVPQAEASRFAVQHTRCGQGY
jgi:hypothetical protein